MYIRTIKTIIHNSLYASDKWAKNLTHKKMRFSYSKIMCIRMAEPIRIIGYPDNKPPDEWSFTVVQRS